MNATGLLLNDPRRRRPGVSEQRARRARSRLEDCGVRQMPLSWQAAGRRRTREHDTMPDRGAVLSRPLSARDPWPSVPSNPTPSARRPSVTLPRLGSAHGCACAWTAPHGRPASSALSHPPVYWPKAWVCFGGTSTCEIQRHARARRAHIPFAHALRRQLFCSSRSPSVFPLRSPIAS